MSSKGPLCFVLMPFGQKPDAAGTMIGFDAVYGEVIAPAIAGAGMEPLRAGEEVAGGIIHKPMFERRVLALERRGCPAPRAEEMEKETRGARGTLNKPRRRTGRTAGNVHGWSDVDEQPDF
ncbi:MAG TPA: hypothetical protein VHG08_10740 [Longimicrobium sp.]|nr:hypothetical protein [Longimicrobium sp.]